MQVILIAMSSRHAQYSVDMLSPLTVHFSSLLQLLSHSAVSKTNTWARVYLVARSDIAVAVWTSENIFRKSGGVIVI